jgi:hypothetical protein
MVSLCEFIRLEEESTMTIQVAMRGNDGILLAGDTQQRNPLPLRGQYWKEGQEGSNSSKIKIDYDQRIAIACAGDADTSGYIANNLLIAFKANGLSSPIETIQQVARTVQPYDKKEAKCLIVLPGPRLLSVKTTRKIIQNNEVVTEWFPVVKEELSGAIAGDDVSAALFYMEKYYDMRLPTSALIPLGAHIVACAHQLNPRWISGLEIVLCNSDGVNRLSKSSIEELEPRGDEWDRTISGLFLNYQQHYTWEKY